MLDEDDGYEYAREHARKLVTAAAGGEPAAVEQLLTTVWFAYEVPHDDGFTGIALAVPHLVELLDAPGVDRVRILTVLTEVAEQPADPEHPEGPEPGWVAGLTAAQAGVAAAAPTYRRLLDDDADGVRAWAATLLGRVAAGERDVVETLRRLGRTDPSPVVRASLVVTLAGIGVPVADRLDDPAPLPRFAAAVTGATMPADLRRGLSAAVPGFDQVPRMPDPAWHLCRRLTDRPDLAVDALEVLLAHPDGWLRDDAVRVVGSLLRAWRPAVRLVPVLTRILTDAVAALRSPDEDTGTALDLLGTVWLGDDHIGGALACAAGLTPDAADDLWILSALYQQRSATTCNHALRELCRLRDPRVAGHVTTWLATDEPEWFELEWDVLPRLGPWAAEHCGPALLHHVATAPDGTLRIGVIEALGRVTTPNGRAVAEVVDAVRRRIGSTAVLRAFGGVGTAPDRVARVLGDLGTAAAAALPDLRPLLDHPDAGTRLAAALAGYRIGGDAGPACAELRTALDDADAVEPVAALAVVGAAGAEFAGTLRDRTAHRDPVVAAWAAVAYWRVTGDPEPAVPILVRSLGDPALGLRSTDEPIVSDDPIPPPAGAAAVRAEAVRCLAEIGPAAAPALPLLRAAVTGDRRQVLGSTLADAIAADDAWRRHCACALARIAPTR